MASFHANIAPNLPSPEARWRAFVSGVQAVLQLWTALGLAIDNNWGGGDSNAKAQAMFDDMLSIFRRGKDIYNDVIEDFLLVRMDENFHCRCDDGSIEEVAQILVRMYMECGDGKFDIVQNSIEKLNQRRGKGLNAARQSTAGGEAQEIDDGEDESAGGEDQVPQLVGADVQGNSSMDVQGGVQEDGWETVPIRRKGARR